MQAVRSQHLPQPTHRDLRRFCELDEWDHRRTDHDRYTKTLPDGTILRTKVSFGAGGVDDPALWTRIWREQLALPSEDEFWRVLEEERPADRDTPPGVVVEPVVLKGWVVDHLYRAGYSDDAIAAMSEEQAIELVHEHWARKQEEDDE